MQQTHLRLLSDHQKMKSFMEKLTNTRTDIASFSSPRSPLSYHPINETTSWPHLKPAKLLKIFRQQKESARGGGGCTKARTKRFFSFSASSDYGVYTTPQDHENERLKEWQRWTVTIEFGGKRTNHVAIITFFHYESSAYRSGGMTRLGGEVDVVAYFRAF